MVTTAVGLFAYCSQVSLQRLTLNLFLRNPSTTCLPHLTVNSIPLLSIIVSNTTLDCTALQVPNQISAESAVSYQLNKELSYAASHGPVGQHSLQLFMQGTVHLVKVVNAVEDGVDVFLCDDGLRDGGEG